MDISELVAIEKIRQLKARYFRSMDQKDWDLWEQVFTEDVLIDTTQEGSPLITSRQAFREFLPPMLEGVKTVHHGHTSEIKITSPTSATGVWAMEDNLWWPQSAGGNHLWGTGWYFEKYQKQDSGEWLIAELVLRRIRVEINGKQIFPAGE